jgi:hypothetical protein
MMCFTANNDRTSSRLILTLQTLWRRMAPLPLMMIYLRTRAPRCIPLFFKLLQAHAWTYNHGHGVVASFSRFATKCNRGNLRSIKVRLFQLILLIYWTFSCKIGDAAGKSLLAILPQNGWVFLHAKLRLIHKAAYNRMLPLPARYVDMKADIAIVPTL